MSLRIETKSPKEGTTRIHLYGRLDSNTTPQLDEVLDGVLDGTPKNVVYDLAELEYISSAGLRTIFRAKRAMAQRDGTVNVVSMIPSVAKVFEIVKAMPVESIFASWDELDEYLDKMQRKVSGNE